MGEIKWPKEWAGRNRNPNSFITAFGKLVIDQFCVLNEPLVIGGQYRVKTSTSAGGAPANITSELSRHGIPSRLAGWIGEDRLAKSIAEELHYRGIDLAVRYTGISPMTTVLVTPGGERTPMTNDSVGTLNPGDFSSDWFQDSSVVHLDGYDLLPERFPLAVQKAAELARQNDALVSIDMCAANRMQDPRQVGVEKYRELVGNLRPDVIFANESEAEALQLLERAFDFDPLVVIHRGAKPTAVVRGGTRFEKSVPRISVVDSTGCGDAFAAGFLSGWVAGQSVAKSVDKGHVWAGQVGQVIGAQVPVYNETDLASGNDFVFR